MPSWAFRRKGKGGSTTDKKKLSALWKNNRHLAVLLCAGLILLLLPAGRKNADPDREIAFTDAEERLASVLSQMDGVGETAVLLADGPGRNEGFTGAVVVCRGAASAEVRLRVVEAVSAFTGLGSHEIVVQNMESIGGRS